VWDERGIATALLEFADTLGRPFDVAEFAGRLAMRSRELTGAASTGVVLSGVDGELRIAAASDATARMLQAVQIRYREGPSVDCHRSGRTVHLTDVNNVTRRWPAFGPACAGAGFRSVHAVPLRRHGVGVGTLNLFLLVGRVMSAGVLSVLDSLAGAAAIGILQQRSRQHHEVLAHQLQRALDSRIVVEQAKGVLAERLGIAPEEAFERLRRHARSNHLNVHELACTVVDDAAGTEPLRLTAPGQGRSAESG
jgi:GAF domain-containing protein